MIFVILLLLMLIVSRSELYGFNEGYLDKEQTSVINGIFVIIVFLGHSFKYTSLGSIFDIAYDTFKFHIDQMIVVPFLFYSGFGMMSKTKSGGIQIH